MKTKWEIEFEKWESEAVCLAAVQKNGDALQYIGIKKTLLKIIVTLKIK